MANYKLLSRKPVARDLRCIPQRDLVRILTRLQALAEDPRPKGCEKLSGQERYRVRHGMYRIVYEINDSVVTVTVAAAAVK